MMSLIKNALNNVTDADVEFFKDPKMEVVTAVIFIHVFHKFKDQKI